MRTHIRSKRLPARLPTARRILRPAATPRLVARREPHAPGNISPIAAPTGTSLAEFQSDPYVDYGRFLTPAGGILLCYKDLDERFRYTLWRALAWTAFTGCEGWYLWRASPVASGWINFVCLLAVAGLNWLIVHRPMEVYRRLEIRPDCLIIEGTDVFWLAQMEEWPDLVPDDDGHQLLCGVYGTRFVEYLTIRRFDELDRKPEVFAAHLQDAMQQLWTLLIPVWCSSFLKLYLKHAVTRVASPDDALA